MQTVRRSLKAILSNSPMNEKVLHTVFPEAEWIANSRPLTINLSSPGDNDPLIPSHFLNVHPSLNIPPNVIDERGKFSRKRWRQTQLLVGDLVLIAHYNVNRNQWPLGRVVNISLGWTL